MNYCIKVGVAVASLALFATSALAADGILGTWHGHLKIDTSQLPPAKDPAMQARMAAAVKKQQQMVVLLVMKKDHTFSVTVPTDKTAPPASGTWKQTGSTVLLQGLKDGKTQGPPQSFTLAKDGKSFAMSQRGAVITFSR